MIYVLVMATSMTHFKLGRTDGTCSYTTDENKIPSVPLGTLLKKLSILLLLKSSFLSL